jgi:alkylation response protein AidB-like acyl-CoA dehydrogenase
MARAGKGQVLTINSTIPDRSELTRRARDLAPVLRETAPWAEHNRRLHDDAVEALTDAGVLRMRIPARYGGFESDSATMLEVISEIAQADGSAAWNVAAWSMSAWLAGQFPDHVQDEVLTDDARICGVLSPTASAVPSADGVVVNGSWKFISGASHSRWQVALAMAPTPDGSSQWPVMALIPLSELVIDDDWHTMGLRGTGSVTTIADDVFVPADRVLPLMAVLQGSSASALNVLSPMYRVPMIATGCASFSGTAIGLARAALEAFMARLDRKITYTDHLHQRNAQITHSQLAEASMAIEEAESHAGRLAALVDTKGLSGEAWSMLERTRARAYLGRVFSLAKNASTILSDASGGSSIYTTEPLQRTVRDLHALSMHALMHPATNLELYGRVLCGLEPDTLYV